MPRSAAGAAAALLLASCGGGQPPEVVSQLPPPRSGPAPAAASSVGAPGPLAGLTPLPSSNQVVASVSSGRVDPFAPVGGSGAGAVPAPLKLPPGLVFNGVIRSGGMPEALVQFGGETGTVRIGQRGGRSTPLLPVGWSVASIDVQRGRLTLRQGKQSVTAEL